MHKTAVPFLHSTLDRRDRLSKTQVHILVTGLTYQNPKLNDVRHLQISTPHIQPCASHVYHDHTSVLVHVIKQALHIRPSSAQLVIATGHPLKNSHSKYWAAGLTGSELGRHRHMYNGARNVGAVYIASGKAWCFKPKNGAHEKQSTSRPKPCSRSSNARWASTPLLGR